MRISLHRPHQIGGCISVIEAGGVKVIIDLGSNLPGTDKEELTKAQVEEITAGADAIFFTHYHGDHTGLIHLVPEGIPQLIGNGAKEVMVCKYCTLVRASKRFDGVDSQKYKDAVTALAAAKRMQTYNQAERIDVGNKGKLFITPFFVSHSAFDAYMFLIEAEGKRILHTGDFRGHGYLSKGLWKLIPSAIGQVDILITEGTMLSRADERVQHESVIQAKARRLLQKGGKKNHYVVLCSSTDIDRLAGFHAACENSQSRFLVDKYQKDVLDIFTKYAGAHSKLYDFSGTLVKGKCNFKQELFPYSFLAPVRTSQAEYIGKLKHICPDLQLIYSMWLGYLTGTPKQRNLDIQHIVNDIFGGQYTYLHTSGHADIDTIRKVCEITKPRIGIISIHHDPSTQLSDVLKNGTRIIDESMELSSYGIEYNEYN
jgi:ribonuclease J